MAIGIGVPTGVVNLPTVHMVQTFKGNYLLSRTYSAAVLTNDKYFGSFFFSNETSPAGDRVWGAGYEAGPAARGAYDRGVADAVTTEGNTAVFKAKLFPFDIDGVQGSIKAKGDEKWITFKGMYQTTISFSTVANDGYGVDARLDASEMTLREGRGTYRYKMNREAGMAASIPLSYISGIDKAVSTVAQKYNLAGGVAVGSNNNKVSHKDGGFSAIGEEVNPS